jgi:hypothetical protein
MLDPDTHIDIESSASFCCRGDSVKSSEATMFSAWGKEGLSHLNRRAYPRLTVTIQPADEGGCRRYQDGWEF